MPKALEDLYNSWLVKVSIKVRKQTIFTVFLSTLESRNKNSIILPLFEYSLTILRSFLQPNNNFLMRELLYSCYRLRLLNNQSKHIHYAMKNQYYKKYKLFLEFIGLFHPQLILTHKRLPYLMSNLIKMTNNILIHFANKLISQLSSNYK